MYTHNHFSKIYKKGTLLEFLEDDELRYCTITDIEFLALGCQGTFRYIGYYPKKRYSTHVSVSNTDYWVRQSLKLYDYDEYRKHFGFTRRGVYGKALTRLLDSARPIHTLDALKSDSHAWSSFQLAKKEAKLYLFGTSGPVPALSNWSGAVAALPTNTSAGSSFPGRKKGEVIGLAVNIAERMWNGIVENKDKPLFRRCYPPPCTIAVRGHLSPLNKNKSRCVIVYPYEVQLLEARIAKNLYNVMKAQGQLVTGKQSLKRLYEYLQEDPGYDFISLDISGFDRMRNIDLIREAFSVLEGMLTLTDDEQEVFKWLQHYYIKTPILLASGHCFFQLGGIPSGTFFTLMMNTCINYIAQKTIVNYYRIPVRGFHILGDDNAFKIRPEINYMVRYFPDHINKNKEWFCMKINTEKTIRTNRVFDRSFIGYKFKQMRLWREDDEWFRSALYPERDVKNVAISFSRMFSYFCIGGCNSPKFYGFFEFFLTCYQNHLRKYKEKLYQRSVFRFGSLRVFKDVLDFKEEDVIHLDFDGFLNKIDYDKIPLMFTLGLSLRKDRY